MRGACALVRNSECCGSKHVSFPPNGAQAEQCKLIFFSPFSFLFFFSFCINGFTVTEEREWSSSIDPRNPN